MKNKNILVTGADGFIGSHLVEMLVKQEARVKALSFYNSFNNWGWLEDIDCLKQIEVLNGDIRDSHYCKRITKDIKIREKIFNLALDLAEEIGGKEFRDEVKSSNPANTQKINIR